MDYIIRWKHHKSCGKMAKNFQETANSFWTQGWRHTKLPLLVTKILKDKAYVS
jgi:hypothetical protein